MFDVYLRGSRSECQDTTDRSTNLQGRLRCHNDVYTSSL